MDIVAILKLVVGFVPYARDLVATIASLQGRTNEPGVLDIIAQLSPIATSLMSMIDNIHRQTATTHAAVWAPVRDDWKHTFAQWNALQACWVTPW